MTVYLHPEETTISQFYAKPTFELLDVNKQKHPVVCLSALPSKTEDMEITSCHLRVSPGHTSYPSFIKQSTIYTKQDQGRAQTIQPCHMHCHHSPCLPRYWEPYQLWESFWLATKFNECNQ